MAKWAIEIAAHDINYEAHKAIKSQALADFLVEWMETQSLFRCGLNNGSCTSADPRCLQTRGLGSSLFFLKATSSDMYCIFTLLHLTTLWSMKPCCMACGSLYGFRGLLCGEDSDLVVQQVMKDGDAKDPSMIVYREEVASSKKS